MRTLLEPHTDAPSRNRPARFAMSTVPRAASCIHGAKMQRTRIDSDATAPPAALAYSHPQD